MAVRDLTADFTVEELNAELVLFLDKWNPRVNRVCVDLAYPLVENGADIDTLDNQGETLLHKACADGFNEVISFCIEKGANLNILSKDGRSPLMTVIQDYKPTSAQMLIEAGADVNLQDKHGKTALMYAIERRSFQTVEALLESGADVSLKRYRKGPCTALDLSKSLGFDGLTELIENHIQAKEAESSAQREDSISSVFQPR